MVLADGQRQERTKHLQVKFRRGLLSETEEDFCVEYFVHTGLPEDRDTEMLFSPRSRISGYDSKEDQIQNGWTDEERELVETALRNSYAYGDEFVELTKVAAVKPWPTYDTTPVESIVDIAQAIGIPLADVLVYEKENAFRLEVLEAVGYVLLNPEEETELVIEA